MGHSAECGTCVGHPSILVELAVHRHDCGLVLSWLVLSSLRHPDARETTEVCAPAPPGRVPLARAPVVCAKRNPHQGSGMDVQKQIVALGCCDGLRTDADM